MKRETFTDSKPTAAPIEVIARNIEAGEYPKSDAQYYSEADWDIATAYALEDGDYSELVDMLNMEATAERFARLSERQQDSWMGLENYFAARPVESAYLVGAV